MADLQDVKNQLKAFRLRPKSFQDFSSPVSPSSSLPTITPSSSDSSLKSSISSSSRSSSGSASLTGPATGPGGRPLSHHRRKSSVSTRRESNEIMGVPCPPEDEDHASRDEIRKRTLLALEGRSVVTGFAKVEIPEWNTPTGDSKTFDWELPNISLHGSNPFMGKRDSFGRNLVTASIPNKAELHTLVEEDEEEEEFGRAKLPVSSARIPTTHVIGPSPNKPRPASLSLRSLSLVGDLPTPTSTPSPRGTGSMRPLTLQPSPSFYTPTSQHSASLSSSPSSPVTPSPLANPAIMTVARRQSRLSYRRTSTASSTESVVDMGNAPLTPSRTPQSSISSSASHERPLSPTEVFAQQAYTLQNHASLLARIATLEDALADAQRRCSSADELIALVADLKAERDSLAGNVAAAEDRQAELQRTTEVSKKRLEAARQEAWLHGDRAEMLQVQLDQVTAERTRLELEKAAWIEERVTVEREKKVRLLEIEILEERVERLQHDLNNSVQAQGGRYMSSIDSRSSSPAATVVDELGSSVSSVDSFRFSTIKLKDVETDLAVVAEEDEVNDNMDQISRDDESDDGQDALASYESEPTEFMDYLQETYDNEGESEMGDDDEHYEDHDLTPTPPHAECFPGTPTPAEAPVPQPTSQHARAPSHSRRASLVINWKFPKGPIPTPNKPPKEVDGYISDALESDDDEGSSDESSRIVTPASSLLGKSLTGGKKGKVGVSPELAETFAVNFAADEDFTFWGHEEFTPEIVVKAPTIASPFLPADIATPAPAPVLAPALVPSVDPRLAGASGGSDLVPPPVEYPAKMGGNIVPLLPAKIPDVKAPAPTLIAPVTPAKPRTSSRPTLSPPSFVSIPKVVQAASRTAPTIVPATNLDESFSFFNSPPTAKNPVSAPSVNIVAFPTSSASPFSMRLSLGSFSSFWSSRTTQVQPSKALPSFDNESEDKCPTKLMAPGVMSPTATRRAQVDRDVMRERLRTRLVQEGKIPTETVRASPASASPPRRVTPKEHICVPGCKRCRGAFVEC